MENSYRIDYYQHSKMDKTEEEEADYFAICLLVPDDLLIRLLRETDNIDVIANCFGVSNAVIRLRINWLKAGDES